MKIEAEGAFFDESLGGLNEVPIKLATYAQAEPGEALNVQINLLTDLIATRLLDRLLAGEEYEVLPELQRELHQALGIGLGDVPEGRPGETNPYSEGYEAAYLLAVSAVIARAGEDWRVRGQGDISDLLDALRADFANDGRLEPDLVDTLRRAEAALDPDLARTSLQLLIEDVGEVRPVPDPHQILDTDQDGIVNDDDNCRYVPNPDQAASGAGPWGAACDDRLAAVDTSADFGCGVRVSDGSVVCWDIHEGDFGGTAPHPGIKPDGVGNPWRDSDVLTRAYLDISVDAYQVCAVGIESGIDCWSPALGTFTLDGQFDRVEASRNRVCGQLADGSLTCADALGGVILTDTDPVLDFALVEGDSLVVVTETGALEWWDVGAGTDLWALPSGTFQAVASGGAA